VFAAFPFVRLEVQSPKLLVASQLQGPQLKCARLI